MNWKGCHDNRSLLYTEVYNYMPQWNVIYIIVIVLCNGNVIGLKIALHNMTWSVGTT